MVASRSAPAHQPRRAPAAVVERLNPAGRGAPPWVRAQHFYRYAWAATQVSGRRVLDVACGTGYGSAMLAAGGATAVTGVDRDLSAIDAAERTVLDRRCRFQVGDATALPFAAGSFDVVVSFETIEHIAEERAYLREMRRMVRPGGLFLVSTPNRVVMNPGRTIGDGSFNPHHVREYDRAEFVERLGYHFTHVALFGQSPYDRGYVGALSALARVHWLAAVRVHQLRKLVTAPFVPRVRHDVRPVWPGQEPEFFVARCQT